MLESFDKILQRQEDNFRKRIAELEMLEDIMRKRVRPGIKLGTATGNASASAMAVDSAYKSSDEDILRRVEYAVVGVATWITSYDVIGFHERDAALAIYEEDTAEEESLLKALGAVAEMQLLYRNAGQTRWAFLDGSLFSTLIRLKAGLAVAIKRGAGGIYARAREEILKCSEYLNEVLRHGNLITVPKRSTGEEFKACVLPLWEGAENFNDFELATMCLENGEYVDLSSHVEQGRVNVLLDGMKKLGFQVDRVIEEKLRNFGLFYVKGYDGVVHRVEFFGSKEYFPADMVALQSVSGTSELALIAHADRMAKEYLKALFPDSNMPFGSFK